MENPLEDAETMKLDSSGHILEFGKKPMSYNDIEGQYIGLFKVSGNGIEEARELYHDLKRNTGDESKFDGKDFDNMYMTSFIRLIIDKVSSVKANIINGGWLEFKDELGEIWWARPMG